MKYLVLFSLTIILLLSSCKNEDNPVNQNYLPELLPLKIGNWWAFQRTDFDSTGNIVSTFADTMRVLRDTVIQNEHWFITNHGIYRNAKDGLRYWSWSDNSSYVYSYPANENDIFIMGSAIVKVKSVNEKISVPCGDFSCYHYQAELSQLYNWQINYFLSPGIGFVSSEGPSWTSSGKYYIYYREKLLSYALK